MPTPLAPVWSYPWPPLNVKGPRHLLNVCNIWKLKLAQCSSTLSPISNIMNFMLKMADFVLHVWRLFVCSISCMLQWYFVSHLKSSNQSWDICVSMPFAVLYKWETVLYLLTFLSWSLELFFSTLGQKGFWQSPFTLLHLFFTFLISSSLFTCRTSASLLLPFCSSDFLFLVFFLHSHPLSVSKCPAKTPYGNKKAEENCLTDWHVSYMYNCTCTVVYH